MTSKIATIVSERGLMENRDFKDNFMAEIIQEKIGVQFSWCIRSQLLP